MSVSCLQLLAAQEPQEDSAEPGRRHKLLDRAKRGAGILFVLKDFARQIGAVEKFSARAGADRKLEVSIDRESASRLKLDGLEKFGVQVKSLELDKHISFKAGGSPTGVELDEIKGIGVGLVIGVLPAKIIVRKAGLRRDDAGKLHFTCTISHKTIPLPLPLDIPL